MVFNYAKLALFTGLTLVADAKRGKYGYRKNVDDTDEIVNDSDAEIVADSWDAQEDSRRPDIDIDDIRERLRDRKKDKKSKKSSKKQKASEKDFARGVLEAIVEAVAETDDPEQTIKLGQLGAMFDAIVGNDFDPEGNKAFDRGFKFGDKKLYGGERGCRDECRLAPFAEGCQECCITFDHVVDWNCDSTDPDKPPAKCCTEWTAECYTTDSEDNNNHACKDCYGYGRGYGGYGRGYGRWGRRRASQGYGGRRRARYGYGGGRGYGGYGYRG